MFVFLNVSNFFWSVVSFYHQSKLTHTYNMRLYHLLIFIISLVVVKSEIYEPSTPDSSRSYDLDPGAFQFCGVVSVSDGQESTLTFENAFTASTDLTKTDCIVECTNPSSNFLDGIPFTVIDFTKIVYFASGPVGHFILMITVLFCACPCKCLPRKIRRIIFSMASFYMSIALSCQLIQLSVCEHQLIMYFITEYLIICVIFAFSSRTWNHLKIMRVLGTGKNFNIWKELKIDAAPEIRIHIECYHYETVHYTDSDGKSKTRQEKRVTYRATELVPYSCWWIGDGIGDPNAVESASKTYVGTFDDLMTFLAFEYSIQAVDSFTTDKIEEARIHHHLMNRNRDAHCDVTTHIHAEHGPNKISLKPESMPLPVICQTWFFWLFTVLPVPFFNGALIRLIVDSKYSVEVRKSIVRFVEIRPGTFGTPANQVKPHMNPSKGYQLSNMLYSDMDLHQRVDLQRLPV